MHADLKGALRAIEKSWRAFENNGKPLNKSEVELVLKYGIEKGYKTTADFKESEVDDLLNSNRWWNSISPSFQYYHLRKNEINQSDYHSVIKMFKIHNTCTEEKE